MEASRRLRDELDRARSADQELLWGICYRMTGSAADADDLVQETWVRALERPPRRLDEPLRPWLVRVAVNLARDHLRRRRRRGYSGPWLPAPIELGPDAEPAAEPGADARYERLESAGFAFLIALEALTPQQRAVLVLRDVYEHSVRETAELLGLSQANVKTTLHRARRAMAGYDAERGRPDPGRHADALARFVDCLARGDAGGLERLLCEDARLVTDGGGEFLAALRPIVGRARVARFWLRTGAHDLPPARMRACGLNGLPGLLWEYERAPHPRAARRYALSCALAQDGRIAALYLVAASRKLGAVSFASA